MPGGRGIRHRETLSSKDGGMTDGHLSVWREKAFLASLFSAGRYMCEQVVHYVLAPVDGLHASEERGLLIHTAGPCQPSTCCRHNDKDDDYCHNNNNDGQLQILHAHGPGEVSACGLKGDRRVHKVFCLIY